MYSRFASQSFAIKYAYCSHWFCRLTRVRITNSGRVLCTALTKTLRLCQFWRQDVVESKIARVCCNFAKCGSITELSQYFVAFLSIIVFYVISLQDSCLESTQLEWPCWRLYKITSATQSVTDATCTTRLTFYVQKMSSTYIQVMSTDHEYKVHKTQSICCSGSTRAFYGRRLSLKRNFLLWV